MIDQEVAVHFLNKMCGVIRIDNGKQIFCRGLITKVTNSCLILDFMGNQQAISLSAIENIREVERDQNR